MLMAIACVPNETMPCWQCCSVAAFADRSWSAWKWMRCRCAKVTGQSIIFGRDTSVTYSASSPLLQLVQNLERRPYGGQTSGFHDFPSTNRTHQLNDLART